MSFYIEHLICVHINTWLMEVELLSWSLHWPSAASRLIVLVSHGCGLRVLRCIVGSARGRRKLLWHDVLSFSAGHLSWSFILWRLLDVPCVVSPRPSLEHILTTTSWTKIRSHNGKTFCCQMLMVTLRCRCPRYDQGWRIPEALAAFPQASCQLYMAKVSSSLPLQKVYRCIVFMLRRIDQNFHIGHFYNSIIYYCIWSVTVLIMEY